MTTTFKGLISPTREKEYTLLDLLNKALVRSDVKIQLTTPKQVATTGYGDRDYTLNVDVWIGDPVWNSGIAGWIEMKVPAHTCANWNFSGLSFQCGSAFGEDAPDLTRQTSELYIHAEAWISDNRPSSDKNAVVKLVGSDVVKYLHENANVVKQIIERELLSSYFTNSPK